MADGFKAWYAEEGSDGWTLNESNPGASDGWLADFGRGGEDACKQAAREHNAIPDLLTACKRALHLVEENNAEIVTMVGSFGLLADLEAAIAKMGG